MKKVLKNKKKLSVIIFFFLFLFLMQGEIASAKEEGKIYFEISNESPTPETDFNASVLLDTQTLINAFDLEISYPKEKLQFLNSDNGRSIANIWQGAPAILKNGSIHLAGGLLKPFKGNKGLIVKLLFKTKKEGEAKLSFGKNDIYIADGKGTKLSLIAFSSDVSVIKSPIENSKNNSSISSISSIPSSSDKIDNSPPTILLQLTKSPVDDSTLIAFYANDPESGIKQTRMRIKKWWSYSEWQIAQNPVLYPKDVWAVELQAINNAGLENIKTLKTPWKLFRKTIPIIMIIIFGVWVYNNHRRNI